LTEAIFINGYTKDNLQIFYNKRFLGGSRTL